MDVIADSEGLRAQLSALKAQGRRLAFVPTMGNLHEGHLALVRQAQKVSDDVVVSIFVNPKQFGANEDLDAYPRTLTEDLEKLNSLGTTLVFTPSDASMYPEGVAAHTTVSVPGLTDVLCGANRPGHFDGVATIVCKLLNIVAPDVAIFGEKDLQQLLLIKKLARDLAIPVEIAGVATERAPDGLALSSRNGYLSGAERELAPLLYQTLSDIGQALSRGSRDYAGLCQHGATALISAGFECDYLEIRRRVDLKIAAQDDRQIAIFVAARLGTTRLIDNLQLDL